LHAVLEQVRLGGEVVIEQNRQPVAIVKPAVTNAPGMSGIISVMEAGGVRGIVDEDFSRDVRSLRLAADDVPIDWRSADSRPAGDEIACPTMLS
jgi:hypothetical protein